MKVCSKCNKENNEEAKFCNFCGERLDSNMTINEEKLYDIMNNLNNEKKKARGNLLNCKSISIICAIVAVLIIIIVAININNASKFKKVYDYILDNNSTLYPYIKLADDDSYLKVDTNPNNKDDYFMLSAYNMVKDVNEALGLPEIVFTKMGETRSIDGRITEVYNGIKVSWIYHPDKGLEIIYEKDK